MTDLDQHAAAICQGDADAFGRWLAAAEPELRVSLRSFAATVDTEAVLQEALLRLWQVAPRFESDGKPNGLLRLGLRIARNLAVSEVRKARLRGTEPGDLERRQARLAVRGAAPTPPDPLLRKVIQACRDKLPKKPALVLLERLRSAGGEHDATIAERLGMRKNTFLQNFTRARKLLAECLQRHGVVLEAELPS